MDRFAFLSGLPRTGSTVLGTLLSQHPDLHPTRTSCIRNLMVSARSYSLGESPYFDIKDRNSQLWGILRGTLYGAYQNVSKEVVIEKDRGWAKDAGLLTKVLGEPPVYLSPVRPIPEIIASFILLSRKIGITSKIEDEVKSLGRESNVWSLSRIIWEKYIYLDWRSLKTGYEAHPECFMFVHYDDIVTNPQETMDTICDRLNVKRNTFTTNNLKNPNPENDAVYGMPGLHTVKPELKRTSPPAWEVLGDECYEFWASQKMEFWAPG